MITEAENIGAGCEGASERRGSNQFSESTEITGRRVVRDESRICAAAIFCGRDAELGRLEECGLRAHRSLGCLFIFEILRYFELCKLLCSLAHSVSFTAADMPNELPSELGRLLNSATLKQSMVPILLRRALGH